MLSVVFVSSFAWYQHVHDATRSTLTDAELVDLIVTYRRLQWVFGAGAATGFALLLSAVVARWRPSSTER